MEFKGKIKDVIKNQITRKDGSVIEVVKIVVEEVGCAYPASGVFTLDTRKVPTDIQKDDNVEFMYNMKAKASLSGYYHDNVIWRLRRVAV